MENYLSWVKLLKFYKGIGSCEIFKEQLKKYFKYSYVALLVAVVATFSLKIHFLKERLCDSP